MPPGAVFVWGYSDSWNCAGPGTASESTHTALGWCVLRRCPAEAETADERGQRASAGGASWGGPGAEPPMKGF
eukprot:13611567-Alexandrium_andersonii.AAC.1